MRVAELNRNVMFLGGVAVLLRALFPPKSYITESGSRLPSALLENLNLMESGRRVPPSLLENGYHGIAGPDLGMLVVHLAAIVIGTLFLAYALRPAAKPRERTHASTADAPGRPQAATD